MVVISKAPIPDVKQKTGVGRHGELRLSFVMQEKQTSLRESFFRPPLQVMRPITDSAGCMGIYILSPTGGIVQGDQYHIDIKLEPHTHALITTIAATKVYKMPDECATQHIHIEVGEGAILEFLPDALILFKDADFHQYVGITLHSGAVCLLQDIVMGGRIARGEVLQFRRFLNHICVKDPQGLVMVDNADFSPMVNDIDQAGLLNGFPCWASWYMLGDLAGHGIDATEFCQQHHDIESPHAIGSLSTLYRNGLAARMLSHRLEAVTNTFEDLRRHFRQAIGRPYSDLRK